MAILTINELVELRRSCAKGEHPDWVKSQINSALQAIEDYFEANKANISAAIDSATAPYVFSGLLKKKEVAYWFRQKFRREGV